MHYDTTRIEKWLIKENWLILMGFPTSGGQGYVPLRCIAREQFYWMYDPIQEGQISANVPADANIGLSTNNGINDLGFQIPQMPGSQYMTGKPNNAFWVTNTDILYQLFMGIAPSILRIFLEAPAATGQRNPDIDHWGANRAQFGYIDGFDSPLMFPSATSELVIPPQFNIAIGYGNPGPQTVNPLLYFTTNKLKVEVVKDPYLVDAMLQGKVPVSIKTIGGLSSYSYNVENIYGIDPIPLGSSLQQIASALGVSLSRSAK